MFGVLETKGCRWSPEAKSQWWGHICGTCVALRDHCGQLARATTNYDAALVSALCEAQSATPLATVDHFCPLRGFRTAAVVAPDTPAARYAASVSTLMAATKIDDHLDDGDHWVARIPALFRALAQRWRRGARRLAEGLGFETASVEQRVADQSEIERQSGRDFFFYSRPTEESVGDVCAHTATLMERPQNAGPLREIGRLFGRIMFLLDSYRDLDQDRKSGQFNALDASTPDSEISIEARKWFAEAHQRIRELLSRLELREPGLVQRLLVTELGAIGHRTFHHSPTDLGESERSKRREKRKKPWNCFDCCDFCYSCLDGISCGGRCCSRSRTCCDGDGCCVDGCCCCCCD